jgi:hypothetical protein
MPPAVATFVWLGILAVEGGMIGLLALSGGRS